MKVVGAEQMVALEGPVESRQDETDRRRLYATREAGDRCESEMQEQEQDVQCRVH